MVDDSDEIPQLKQLCFQQLPPADRQLLGKQEVGCVGGRVDQSMPKRCQVCGPESFAGNLAFIEHPQASVQLLDRQAAVVRHAYNLGGRRAVPIEEYP
jgi:hypothetical protein